MTAEALRCAAFRSPWGSIIGVALIACTEYQTQTPNDVVAERPTAQPVRIGPPAGVRPVGAAPPVLAPANVDEFLLTPNQIAETNARAAAEQQHSASAGASAHGAGGLSDGEESDGSVGVPERDGSEPPSSGVGRSPPAGRPSAREPPAAGEPAQPAYPPTVRGAIDWFRAKRRRESDEMRERALARGADPLQEPYPSPQDQAIEVAFAFCMVTLVAQGYSLQVRSLADFALGPYLECVGAATYSSDWQTRMRLVLEDWGAASAFRIVPPAIWERCVDAMIRAPRARVRRGEAFGLYCVPAVSRAWRRRR